MKILCVLFLLFSLNSFASGQRISLKRVTNLDFKKAPNNSILITYKKNVDTADELVLLSAVSNTTDMEILDSLGVSSLMYIYELLDLGLMCKTAELRSKTQDNCKLEEIGLVIYVFNLLKSNEPELTKIIDQAIAELYITISIDKKNVSFETLRSKVKLILNKATGYDYSSLKKEEVGQAALSEISKNNRLSLGTSFGALSIQNLSTFFDAMYVIASSIKADYWSKERMESAVRGIGNNEVYEHIYNIQNDSVTLLKRLVSLQMNFGDTSHIELERIRAVILAASLELVKRARRCSQTLEPHGDLLIGHD